MSLNKNRTGRVAMQFTANTRCMVEVSPCSLGTVISRPAAMQATDRQLDRQTNRKTDRRTDGQTDRQTDRQTAGRRTD